MCVLSGMYVVPKARASDHQLGRWLLFVRTRGHGRELRPEARNVVGEFSNASVRRAGINLLVDAAGW